MKTFILTWIALLGIVVVTFAQAQKTLVKTLAVEEPTYEVVFDLPGNVEVMKWDNKTIRIITTITAQNTQEQVLKALVAAGRYNYEMLVDETTGKITIDMPQKEQIIIINNVDLDEQLEFEIYLPRGIKYRIGTTDTFMLM